MDCNNACLVVSIVVSLVTCLGLIGAFLEGGSGDGDG
jgi:hypothetical protein